MHLSNFFCKQKSQFYTNNFIFFDIDILDIFSISQQRNFIVVYTLHEN